MRVVMIGTGYVGLVSGTCFSEFGVDVTCVDKQQDKIDDLNAGNIPIFEPGLDDLFLKNVKAGRLRFTTDIKVAVSGADAIFICVGTPTDPVSGHADLSNVFSAASEIAEAIDGYTVIVTKSTVPVGTGQKVEELIQASCPNADFDVVSNPEYLREGSAINDFMRPDRIVIGSNSERAQKVMRNLYRPLFLIETPILFTQLQTSELIKYAANSFLAMKITFINEIADLCEKVGADVQDVAKGIGLDGRIGSKFLHAGPGYGGSCFPKDTLALVNTAHKVGSPLKIIETVVKVNNKRKTSISNRIIAACDGSLEGKTIAVLGVTFKPNTDDMRESPSIDILPALQKAGATIRAYDPEGMDEARKMFEGIIWCENSYEVMQGSDALVIITEWNAFRGLDLKRVKSLLRKPVLVDLRNIYNPDDMANIGIDYHCLGRPFGKAS